MRPVLNIARLVCALNLAKHAVVTAALIIEDRAGKNTANPLDESWDVFLSLVSESYVS